MKSSSQLVSVAGARPIDVRCTTSVIAVCSTSETAIAAPFDRCQSTLLRSPPPRQPNPRAPLPLPHAQRQRGGDNPDRDAYSCVTGLPDRVAPGWSFGGRPDPAEEGQPGRVVAESRAATLRSSPSLGRLLVLARSEEMPADCWPVGPNPSAGSCVNVCEVLRPGAAVVLWTVSRPGPGGWGGVGHHPLLTQPASAPPAHPTEGRRIGRRGRSPIGRPSGHPDGPPALRAMTLHRVGAAGLRCLELAAPFNAKPLARDRHHEHRLPPPVATLVHRSLSLPIPAHAAIAVGHHSPPRSAMLRYQARRTPIVSPPSNAHHASPSSKSRYGCQSPGPANSPGSRDGSNNRSICSGSGGAGA
jgi:hypothetical protein